MKKNARPPHTPAGQAMGLSLVVTLAIPGPVTAQHEHDPGRHVVEAESPHVELQGREIKALAPEEIDGLLAGEGLGFALAAELNGLPGPRHALELAEPLGLTAEQRARTEAIFGAMREEAIALGRALVSAERELDHALAGRSIRHDQLRRRSEEIGTLRGRLRGAHLAAHVAMLEVLTAEQVRRYGSLRGYATEP